MADNITLNSGSGGATLATDDDGVAHHQYVKVEFGADNTQTPVSATNPIPVGGSGANAIGKAIDAVVGSSDVGAAVLAKHLEDQVHLTTADGDYDILTVDSLGSLHVNAEAHHIFDDMNATTGWAALNSDTTGLATTTKHVMGTNALEFDKVDGAANTVFGAIAKTLSSVDLGSISPHDIIQTSCYMSSIANLAYVFIRLGTDSSNYNEWRIADDQLTAGVFDTLAFIVGDANYDGITGNGWDPSAVTYICVGAAFDAQNNTLANIVFDQVSYHTNQHTSTSLNAEVSSSVSSPNVKLNGYGGSTDTGTGNASASTLRVAIADDDTNLAAILADTANMDTNLGTVAGAVSGTEMQVDIVSGGGTAAADDADFVAGTTQGTLIQGVYESSPSSVTDGDMGAVGISSDRRLHVDAQIVGTDAALDVSGATVTVDLGANNDVTIDNSSIVHAEDATHSSGNAGIMPLAVRNDDLAALAGTDGDYAPLQVNADGALFVAQGPSTSGGISSVYRDEDIDETAVAVKASAGQVYWIHVINLDATPVYLHLYDVAQGSVTVGTTGELCTFAIPSQGDANGAGFTMHFDHGIEFSTAITAACTTTINGTAGPATNEVILNIGYA